MSKYIKNLVSRLLSDLTRRLGETESKLEEINSGQAQARSEAQQTSERLKNAGWYRVSDREIIAKIFSGVKIFLDPRDISVVPHLILDTIWEPDITTAWLSALRPNDTVIDIGANFGYFGILAAQKTDKKNSRVVFFEANPGLAVYIEKSLSMNWLNEQSTVESLAITDRTGRGKLNILKDYIGSSTMQSMAELNDYMGNKMKVGVEQTVEVPTITLDDYCQENKLPKVDLIKMDIEGFEEKAYKGMRKIIAASPEVTLFVEFTRGGYKAPKQFYKQMLKDFGHVYLIDQEGYINKPQNNDYESVVSDSDDWIMPVFSKRSNLDSLRKRND